MAKPIQENQPAIIFSVKYVTAAAVKGKMSFKGFSKYTERDNATDLINDIDLNQNYSENSEPEEDLTQGPSKNPRPFKEFIDYTARNTATNLDQQQTKSIDPGQKLTPTFDQQKDHLTVKDTDELRDKLDKAQGNNGTLWAGVFSYSTKFLIENNLYDPETGSCDQHKIKAAIRQNMGDLLKSNGLDKEGFWWGDIQFNTEHIHVHIGISELSPRPTSAVNRKGQIVEKEDKNVKLELEKRLGVPRSTLREQLIDKTRPSQLQSLFNSLPEDKKLWRYRSNAKEMRPAKDLAKKIVDDYLDGNPKYKSFTHILLELDKYNSKAFGRKTAGRTFDNKDHELKERLTNALFRACRELPKDQTKITVEGIANNYDPKSIQQNSARIKELSNTQGMNDKQRRELRQRLSALKRQHIHVERDNAQNKQEKLQEILKRPAKGSAERAVVDFLKARYQERIELAELKLKPIWKQTDTDNNRLNELNAYFTDINKISVERLSPQLQVQLKRRLSDEMDINENLDWLNLRPSLRRALANEVRMNGSMQHLNHNQLKKMQGRQARLLRLKSSLSDKGSEDIPDKVIKQRQQQIQRLAKLIKKQQGQTDQNNQPKGSTIKHNQQVPKDEKWFAQQQKQQGKSIVKQASQAVKNELQQVRRGEIEKSNAQRAMADQQRLIERDQQEQER
ncbi:relaxase MobL [Lactiplantibacillus plantarum]|uniref:relaxase MobL n=1 Tax=Lactiplantibacillus plantarum TaxID=1590 RepID=UPI0009765DF0|nr:relaxase MobL [Lactiplantibacillus plantarum]